MTALYLERKGKNEEFIKLEPIDLTETEVLYKNGSETASIKLSDCFIWEEDDSQTNAQLSSGDAVEMLRESDARWWPATVYNVKGDFVTCLINHSSEQEVADRCQVRPAGSSKLLSSIRFHTCVLHLPEPLLQQTNQQHLQDAPLPTEAEVRAELAQCRLSGPCLLLRSDANTVALATPSETDAKRLNMIGELMGRRLRWKAAIRKDLDAVSRCLNTAESFNGSGTAPRRSSHIEEFPVPSHLVGLALGHKGSNAAEARRLPGVKAIRYDDTAGVFRVFGLDAESVAAARRKLELTEVTLKPPAGLVGRLVGKGGHAAKDVVEKTQLHKLIVENPEEVEPEAGDISGDAEKQTVRVTPITLVGTPDAVENARYILEYQIDCLSDLDNLSRQKDEVRAQLYAGGGFGRGRNKSECDSGDRLEPRSQPVSPQPTLQLQQQLEQPVSQTLPSQITQQPQPLPQASTMPQKPQPHPQATKKSQPPQKLQQQKQQPQTQPPQKIQKQPQKPVGQSEAPEKLQQQPQSQLNSSIMTSQRESSVDNHQSKNPAVRTAKGTNGHHQNGVGNNSNNSVGTRGRIRHTNYNGGYHDYDNGDYGDHNGYNNGYRWYNNENSRMQQWYQEYQQYFASHGWQGNGGHQQGYRYQQSYRARSSDTRQGPH